MSVTDSLCVWGLLTRKKITISTPTYILVYVTTYAKETSINFFPTCAHVATFNWQFQHYACMI